MEPYPKICQIQYGRERDTLFRVCQLGRTHKRCWICQHNGEMEKEWRNNRLAGKPPILRHCFASWRRIVIEDNTLCSIFILGWPRSSTPFRFVVIPFAIGRRIRRGSMFPRIIWPESRWANYILTPAGITSVAAVFYIILIDHKRRSEIWCISGLGGRCEMARRHVLNSELTVDEMFG
jgi:hypothetical protein